MKPDFLEAALVRDEIGILFELRASESSNVDG